MSSAAAAARNAGAAGSCGPSPPSLCEPCVARPSAGVRVAFGLAPAGAGVLRGDARAARHGIRGTPTRRATETVPVRVVRKRPRAALPGAADAARDAVRLREEHARERAREREAAREREDQGGKGKGRVVEKVREKETEITRSRVERGRFRTKVREKEKEAGKEKERERSGWRFRGRAAETEKVAKEGKLKVKTVERDRRDKQPAPSVANNGGGASSSASGSPGSEGAGAGGGGTGISTSGPGDRAASDAKAALGGGRSGGGSISSGGSSSNGGSVGGGKPVDDGEEELEFFVVSGDTPRVSLPGGPSGVGAPSVAQNATTGGMGLSPPVAATPSLHGAAEGVGRGSSAAAGVRVDAAVVGDGIGAKELGGVDPETVAGKRVPDGGGGPGSGVGARDGGDSHVGVAGGKGGRGSAEDSTIGGGRDTGAIGVESSGGDGTGTAASDQAKTKKVLPVPGSPVGVDGSGSSVDVGGGSSTRSARGRFFTLERAGRVGTATRREVSRIITESAITAQMRMPTRREFAVFAWETMLVVALITLLRTGVSRTLRWIHNRLDSSRTGSTKPTFPYEQSVFECLQRPLEMVSIFTVGTAAAEVLSRPLVAKGSNLLRYIRTLRELGVIFAATWFLLRWIDRIRMRFAVDKRIDKAQVDATSRVATVVTTVIAILISLDSVGVNVQTVLAFGGIGGVAIGFAGREIISNFFGGFMIFLTRPFSVGEWIRSIEEQDVNGTVEDIGWYLTRVRTWDKRPLYIPNSRFSTLIVENPSRMSNRRILHTLHLRLEDMPVVAKVVDGIDQLLKKHPELDPKQHRLAYVDSFDEFSVRIWMSCYTKSVFLFDWRRIQQELLLSVYGILREHGARLATTTTRDVRPGIDPDRYGPLGAAASYRNRQTASLASSVPGGAGSAGAMRAPEEHMDGPHAPSIVADIESGLVEEEGARAVGAAAASVGFVKGVPPTQGTTPVPPGPAGSADRGSPISAHGSSVGSELAGLAASGSGSEAGAGSGSIASGSAGGSDSVGNAVSTASGTASGGDVHSKGEERKTSSSPQSMFPSANMPPTAAEALEMAAAAIMAARHNQRRSDGRQSGASSPSSSSVQDPEDPITPTNVNEAASEAVSGQSGSNVAQPSISNTTARSPAPPSGSPNVSAGGAGGGGVGATRNQVPVSPVASSASGEPASSGAQSGGGGESQAPSGQMKISAAPPIGSSTSSAPRSSGSASSNAPVSGTSSSSLKGGTTPSGSAGTANSSAPSEASTGPTSNPAQSSAVGSTGAKGGTTRSPGGVPKGSGGGGPGTESKAAPSSSAQVTSGPASGQMNISAAPKAKPKTPPSPPPPAASPSDTLQQSLSKGQSVSSNDRDQSSSSSSSALLKQGDPSEKVSGGGEGLSQS